MLWERAQKINAFAYQGTGVSGALGRWEGGPDPVVCQGDGVSGVCQKCTSPRHTEPLPYEFDRIRILPGRPTLR